MDGIIQYQARYPNPVVGGADVWANTLLQDDIPVLPQVRFDRLDLPELQITIAKLMHWAGSGAIQGVLCVIEQAEMNDQLPMIPQNLILYELEDLQKLAPPRENSKNDI